jgi:hypothetical protein
MQTARLWLDRGRTFARGTFFAASLCEQRRPQIIGLQCTHVRLCASVDPVLFCQHHLSLRWERKRFASLGQGNKWQGNKNLYHCRAAAATDAASISRSISSFLFECNCAKEMHLIVARGS